MAIAPGTTNNFQDTDGDGIPDIIESKLTYTDPTVDDRVICTGAGDGAVNLSGQWGMRTNPNGPDNFLVQHLSAYVICHTGQNTLTLYHPEFGYAATATFSNNHLTADWSNLTGLGNITFSADYSAGGGSAGLGTLNGTLTVAGVAIAVGTARQAESNGNFAAAAGGIYGVQIKQLAGKTLFNDPVDDPRNPGSSAVEIQLLDGGGGQLNARVYNADGSVSQAFYVPSIGGLFVGDVRLTSLDFDGSGGANDQLRLVDTSRGLFLRVRTTGTGEDKAGLLRGSDLLRAEVTVNGGSSPTPLQDNLLEWYASDRPASMDVFTYTNPQGQRAVQAVLRNVPLSLETLALTPPGGMATPLVNINGTGDAKLPLAGAMQMRNLIPGLTQDPYAGVVFNIDSATQAVSNPQQITVVPWRSAWDDTPAGDWSFTVGGDAGGSGVLSKNYTPVADAQKLPAVDPATVSLDRSNWGVTAPRENVNTALEHRVSWPLIKTGGVNGTGANRYWVHIYQTQGGPLSFTGPDYLMLQVDVGGTGCAGANNCSVTLPPRLLQRKSQYCLGITARDAGDDNNRSTSDMVQGVPVLCMNAITPGLLQFSATTYSQLENLGSALITVNRVGGSDGAASVQYTTVNGSAIAGRDYTAASGQLDFADGETSKTFSVAISNDNVKENSETVVLRLSGLSGADAGTPLEATLTIADDNDLQTAGQFQMAASTLRVDENAGSAIVKVQRVGGSAGANVVTYRTVNGSANGNAGASGDYVAVVGGTLQFADGETSKEITITINDDSLAEGDESFSIELSGVNGEATLVGPTSTQVTIADDEAPAGKATSGSGKKGGGSLDFVALLVVLLLGGWRGRDVVRRRGVATAA